MSQQGQCAICFLLRHVANCEASGATHPQHSEGFGHPGQIRGDSEGVFSPDYWSSICSDSDGEDSVMGDVDGTDTNEQVSTMRHREDDTVMSDSDESDVHAEQEVFRESDVMEIDDGGWELLGNVCLALPDDSMLIDNGSEQLRKSELVRRFSVEVQSAVAI